MNSAIVRIFPRAVRVAAVASISVVALLFAACNMNAPGSQGAADRAVRAAAVSAAAIPIGSASTFAVLGATTVTNVTPTPVSNITGDLGVSPGTAITGFSSPPNTFSGPGTVTAGTGTVSGTIYAGGPVAAAAHNDATLAYAALIAQVAPTANSFTGVTPLDGLTLAPGVYNFAPAAILNAGKILTLDFGGNPNAVFIFKMGSTLTADANSTIVAINTGGAATPNVYWAVGSSATINGASFIGTVIAVTSITMTSAGNTPAGNTIVAGRMLALGGDVTMVGDTISVVAGSGSGGGGGNPPPVCKDFITGGGWIDGNSDSRGHHERWDCDNATFGISGGIKNGAFWGQLSYNDHGRNGIKVKSTQVTGYLVIDAVTREIDGVATVNGKGSFTYKVVVADKGVGGRHDTFSMDLSNGYSASGTLTGGNIQLHTDCAVTKDDRDRDHNGRENYRDNDEDNGNSNCDR